MEYVQFVENETEHESSRNQGEQSKHETRCDEYKEWEIDEQLYERRCGKRGDIGAEFESDERIGTIVCPTRTITRCAAVNESTSAAAEYDATGASDARTKDAQRESRLWKSGGTSGDGERFARDSTDARIIGFAGALEPDGFAIVRAECAFV